MIYNEVDFYKLLVTSQTYAPFYVAHYVILSF